MIQTLKNREGLKASVNTTEFGDLVSHLVSHVFEKLTMQESGPPAPKTPVRACRDNRELM